MTIYDIRKERNEILGSLPPRKRAFGIQQLLRQGANSSARYSSRPEFWCPTLVPALILARGYANPSVPYTLNLHVPISKQVQIFTGKKPPQRQQHKLTSRGQAAGTEESAQRAVL